MNIRSLHLHSDALISTPLAGAPSLIEHQLPVGRISAESYKEREAGRGQTLPALGGYWKGRKPLILVRAAILGCLLPATEDPIADLKVFLLLLGMADESFITRLKGIKPADISPDFPRYLELVDPIDIKRKRVTWREGISPTQRDKLIAEWLLTIPYSTRIDRCFRPEEVGEKIISVESWVRINSHLGTSASSVADLVDQLGMMRFGHRPKLGDAFAGGGSIPFEGARIGCETFASDLSPVACMLTWGGLNVIGAATEERHKIVTAQQEVSAAVDSELTELGFEHDAVGNRAKAFLYCLETRCPKTGWLVPMAPSWIVSRPRNIVAKLTPIHAAKRYDIEIIADADSQAMIEAESGTLRDGRLVHPMNLEADGVSLSVIRGDFKEDGTNNNRLRLWDKLDFVPRPDDLYQERLYCIQWIEKSSILKGRQETYFASVTAEDMERERRVEQYVQRNLAAWQSEGLVPDMKIAPGAKTDEPTRTRGWTYWHHLFGARDLVFGATVLKHSKHPINYIDLAKSMDLHGRLVRWDSKSHTALNVMYNQALNTLYTWCSRSSFIFTTGGGVEQRSFPLPSGVRATVVNHSASEVHEAADLWITDPPYADAVRYEEITEYFIAWLRKTPVSPFCDWVWSSRREMAIKGVDEKFRAEMVSAYKAMAKCMPDHGMQVVMFTHQNPGVWADLAAVMWTAGLRVTAAWNIVTETVSGLKEGNYVQGTILLILRKRLTSGNIKRMDIEGEIEASVDHQLAILHNLEDDWTSERLYTDGDLQLAAYAAALRVITSYATIDRKEVGSDVYRKLAKGEKTVIRELIEYAASVANNKLVPEGFPPAMWRDLEAPSRFYVRMLEMESKGATKFADYQDFARTFSVIDYNELMDSTKANAASLAGAGALKARVLGGNGFGSSPLRRVLFAIHKTMQKDDPREGLAFLRMEFGQDYWLNRSKLVALAKYVSAKTVKTRPVESSAADLLAQRLEVDKV